MAEDNRFQFTIKKLNSIPFTEKSGRATYYDLLTPGLILRVGEINKTFYLQGRVKGGESVRVSIGKYPAISIDDARESAKLIQGKLIQGINPNKERSDVVEEKETAKILKNKKSSETLGWLFDEYIENHIVKKLGSRPSTLADYKGAKKYFGEKVVQLLKQNEDTGQWELDKVITLPDWLDRPYRSITHQEVLERFRYLSVASSSRKTKILKPIERTHQLNFRYLRSVFNYIIPKAALDNPDDLMRNPLDVISIYKLWEDPKIKTRQLDLEDLSFYKWWKALSAYGYMNGVIRDYLLVSLLQTGRSIDICKLTWSGNINLKKEEIFYYKTKNGQDYTFPMTKMVKEILVRRYKTRTSDWVFDMPNTRPTAKTKFGHVPSNVKHHFKKLYEASGVRISHHDLRRTWSTATMKLKNKVDSKVVDFCLKHAIKGANKHYFIPEREILLEALQTVEDYLVSRFNDYEKKFQFNKEEETV